MTLLRVEGSTGQVGSRGEGILRWIPKLSLRSPGQPPWRHPNTNMAAYFQSWLLLLQIWQTAWDHGLWFQLLSRFRQEECRFSPAFSPVEHFSYKILASIPNTIFLSLSPPVLSLLFNNSAALSSTIERHLNLRFWIALAVRQPADPRDTVSYGRSPSQTLRTRVLRGVWLWEQTAEDRGTSGLNRVLLASPWTVNEPQDPRRMTWRTVLSLWGVEGGHLSGFPENLHVHDKIHPVTQWGQPEGDMRSGSMNFYYAGERSCWEQSLPEPIQAPGIFSYSDTEGQE